MERMQNLPVDPAQAARVVGLVLSLASLIFAGVAGAPSNWP